jgi:hypothetical protein
MSQIKTTIAILGACAAIAACTTPQQRVNNKEDMMSAAGFKVLPANTPARQSALATLPPHKFVREVKNGQVRYAYADPTICNCLYVGDQAAYGRFRQNVFDKKIANEQVMAANDYAMASYDWGPWGGPWGGGYGYGFY